MCVHVYCRGRCTLDRRALQLTVVDTAAESLRPRRPLGQGSSAVGLRPGGICPCPALRKLHNLMMMTMVMTIQAFCRGHLQ